MSNSLYWYNCLPLYKKIPLILPLLYPMRNSVQSDCLEQVASCTVEHSWPWWIGLVWHFKNFWCTGVLLYCWTVELLNCWTVELLNCCTVVLLYCCTVVLLYCCTFVLLYFCTVVLLYCCTVNLLYWCTVVLL